ncbi:hypothetical protein Tco_0001100 [Tanacetum coccineum]
MDSSGEDSSNLCIVSCNGASPISCSSISFILVLSNQPAQLLQRKHLVKAFFAHTIFPCDRVVFNTLWLPAFLCIVPMSLAVKACISNVRRLMLVGCRALELLLQGVQHFLHFPSSSELDSGSSLLQRQGLRLSRNGVLMDLHLLAILSEQDIINPPVEMLQNVKQLNRFHLQIPVRRPSASGGEQLELSTLVGSGTI